MKTEDLLNLKKDIDKSKDELSELKGKKTVLLETLKTEFDCEFKEVDKVKQKLQKKVSVLEAEKQEIIEKLEEEFDF